MNEKSRTTTSSRRTRVRNAESRSKRLVREMFPGLSWRQALIGASIAVILALPTLDFEFQTLPEYQVGDIADRDIEASDAFTVVDTGTTALRRQESLREVPAVFDLDLRVNNRIESELRSAFGEARRIRMEYRAEIGNHDGAPLSEAQYAELRDRLATRFPNMDPELNVLDTLLSAELSADVENQLVGLLREAMRHPGVIASRDIIAIYQERGIVLFNTITRQDEILQDWRAVRGLDQARESIRQNAFQLASLEDQDKLPVLAFVERWVVPNVHFNEAETEGREVLAMEGVSPVLIQVKRGRTIVRAGDEIGTREIMILNELGKRTKAERSAGPWIAALILSSFFVYCFWQYLYFYRARNQSAYRLFLLTSLLLLANLLTVRLHFFLASAVAQSLSIESLQNPMIFNWAAPLTLGSILVVLLAGGQLGIVYSMTIAVFVTMLNPSLPLGIYVIAGGLTAVYSLRQYRERSVMFRAGSYIGLLNVLMILTFHLGAPEFEGLTFAVAASGGFFSGLFSAMLASLLLPPLEHLFAITTDVRLLELSNLNKPILRRLAVEAPGTYHHSIIVGTLGEAAAEAIKANPLLVRVGAYYHDIGKLNKPEYYVENQIYMANKHEGLSPSMSSLILASHVKDGLAMAEEINLAPAVRSLIPQHHGTKLMSYFYQKAKQAAEDRETAVAEEDFRYPGPKPQSREAAILMLADQVEAASRTLQEPSPGQIRGLIRRLIQSTIEDRQFDECDITTRDLHLITRSFERVITGMYHHRIEYPGFNFNKQQVADKQPSNQRIQ